VGHRPTFFINRHGATVVAKAVRVNVGTEEQAAIVARLIEPSVAAMGYEVVRVRFMGGSGRTLQVMVERQDSRPIGVDDCAEVSRLVSALLEVEDPVPGSYILEVSSPGIDRPLVRLDDYARFAGFEAQLETQRPVDGKRRFRGRIKGVEGESVRLDCGGEEAAVPFGEIRSASLVLTDDLIEAAQREAQAATVTES
jgi:ribosome maturation factor RimP